MIETCVYPSAPIPAGVTTGYPVCGKPCRYIPAEDRYEHHCDEHSRRIREAAVACLEME